MVTSCGRLCLYRKKINLKYPLLRLGHFPERFLRKKLYLDLSGGRAARFTVPDIVQVPDERGRPELPEETIIPLDTLRGPGQP